MIWSPVARRRRGNELGLGLMAVVVTASGYVLLLLADKPAVFRELHRVLKPGGRFAVSDIVLLRPLPAAIAGDVHSYVGCVAGASLLSDYLALALAAGFTELSVPQMTGGRALACSLLPGANNDLATLEARYGPVLIEQAAAALLSAKIHGRKAA